MRNFVICTFAKHHFAEISKKDMRCGSCYLYGKNRDAYKDLMLKWKKNNLIGPRSGRDDNENIQIVFKEMEWKGVDFIVIVTKLPVP
jgi:hypothetical protein